MEGGRTVQGFRGIALKLEEKSSVLRWMFVKQHAIRDEIPKKPSDRTLFVINVPPFCSEQCLRCLFEDCGEVTRIYIHQVPDVFLPAEETSSFFSLHAKVKGYRVAYIVFKTPDGLDAALKSDPSKSLTLSSRKFPILCGLDKWRKEYNEAILDPIILKEEIDQFMSKFDEENEKRKIAEKNSMEADGDGWITVTRGGRRPGIRRTEMVKNKIIGKEKVKRPKKELKNFYTFQIRESKMKNLEVLRKKFEEDKRRLNALKQTRKFRPF